MIKVSDFLNAWHPYTFQNWNGSGARPIQRMTLYHAIKLIERLNELDPRFVPTPEFPDLDGDLNFVFYRDPKWTINVCVDPSGFVSCVAFLGDIYQCKGFDYLIEIPDEFIGLLTRFYEDGDATPT